MMSFPPLSRYTFCKSSGSLLYRGCRLLLSVLPLNMDDVADDLFPVPQFVEKLTCAEHNVTLLIISKFARRINPDVFIYNIKGKDHFAISFRDIVSVYGLRVE